MQARSKTSMLTCHDDRLLLPHGMYSIMYHENDPESNPQIMRGAVFRQITKTIPPHGHARYGSRYLKRNSFFSQRIPSSRRSYFSSYFSPYSCLLSLICHGFHLRAQRFLIPEIIMSEHLEIFIKFVNKRNSSGYIYHVLLLFPGSHVPEAETVPRHDTSTGVICNESPDNTAVESCQKLGAALAK